MKYTTKLIIAVIFDLIDLILPPGIEELWDFISTGISIYFFGLEGLIMAWEIVEFTSVLDRFVPTMTIIALLNSRSAQNNKYIKRITRR